MTTKVTSPNWQGQYAAPIDPGAVRFTIAQARVYADCEGCMFIGQRGAVCSRAAEIARANGITDCESPLPNGASGVYVLDKTDPRQIQMELEATGPA